MCIRDSLHPFGVKVIDQLMQVPHRNRVERKLLCREAGRGQEREWNLHSPIGVVGKGSWMSEGLQYQLRVDPVSYTHLDVYKRQVYVMFSPMYQAKWDAQREELLDWESKATSGFAPGELEVIDLPEQVKKPLQANRNNFPDYTHLAPSASETVSESLAAILGDKTKPDRAIEAH